MHGVDVDFCEERSGLRDCRWDKDLTLLARLADVASPHKPGYVGEMKGPPETFREHCASWIDASVRSTVVALGQDVNPSLRHDHQLVCATAIALPESSFREEELCGETDEGLEGLLRESWRWF